MTANKTKATDMTRRPPHETDVADNDPVRRIMDHLSPTHGTDLASLLKTPQQLRQEAIADQTWRHRLRQITIGYPRYAISRLTLRARPTRRTKIVAATATAAIAVVTAVTALAVVLLPQSATAVPGIPGPVPIQFSDERLAKEPSPFTAAQWLNEMAGLLTAAERMSADSQDVITVFTRFQRWSLDSTPDPVPGFYVAQDIQTWRTPDLAGTRQTTTLPKQAAGLTTTAWTGELPASGCPPPQPERFAPGGLHPVITDTPASTWHQLAAQLESHQSLQQGGYATMRSIAALNDDYQLNARQRAAALTLLAHTPGLTYRGQTTDRARRDGIAISTDSTMHHTTTRDILIFHPTTGQLLAHEQVALNQLPAHPKLPTPSTILYTLYLHDHQPKPPCATSP